MLMDPVGYMGWQGAGGLCTGTPWDLGVPEPEGISSQVHMQTENGIFQESEQRDQVFLLGL